MIIIRKLGHEFLLKHTTCVSEVIRNIASITSPSFSQVHLVGNDISLTATR